MMDKFKEITNKMTKHLPHFAIGSIVKGFGRGSKELGIPTANYSNEVVKNLPAELETGIYFGWASIDNGEVHKMVMSIGWNPFFENKQKSMETHILHHYGRDLYSCILKVCILGYLRPETNFSSLDELIKAINTDILQSKEILDRPELLKYKSHSFFTTKENYTNIV